MRIEEKIRRIAYAVFVSAAALALAAAFVDTGTAWYQALQKPEFQPPSIVFSIVWALLYALFAASLALANLACQKPKKAHFLYAAVFVLNALWTYCFFQQEKAAAAVFVLLTTIITALILFLSVYSMNKTAAYLLIPYLLWTAIVLYLNYEIAFLN